MSSREASSTPSVLRAWINQRVVLSGPFFPFQINLGRSDPQYGARRTRRNRFVAIDDGTHDRIRALRVTERAYAKFTQGATVAVKVSPILGYVADVTTIAAPTNQGASDRSSPHEFLARAATAAGGQLAQHVERLNETLSADQRRQG